MTKILAISGSLRAGSHNTGLLRAAARQAPAEVEFELYDRLSDLPPFNQDAEDAPGEAIEDMRARIQGADAVLIATPEYNGSIPGVLKNLIDWASRPVGKGAPLYGKPVLVIGASVTDYGAVWAQDHLRKALGIAGARVTDFELPVARAGEKFDEFGELQHEETAAQVDEAVAKLVDHHRSLGQAVRS
jgi:chromate reductase